MVQHKSSRFNLFYPCSYEDHPHYILFNTLTTSLGVVTQDNWHRLVEGQGNSKEDEQVLFDFHAQGFLVKIDAQEEEIQTHLQQQRIHDMTSFGSKVLLTMACNSSCRYCILEREPVTMSHETAVKMDNLYLSLLEKHRPQNVVDDYLGGEPLLNLDILLQSSSRRSQYCNKNKIKYSLKITTNGLLLSKDCVERLQESGLQEIRVSMAGPAEIHDYLRPDHNGGPTFDTIIDNLKNISGLIPIVVECQYDGMNDSYLRVPEMLDVFIKENIQIQEVNFTPILPQREKKEILGGLDDPKKQIWLVSETRKRSIPNRTGMPSFNCFAELRNRLVFDSLGNILPCPSLQTGELAYGNVETGIDFKGEASLSQRKLPEQCRYKCALLPLCNGGCRNQAYISTGDFSGVDCHSHQLLSSMKQYLKDEVQKAGLDISYTSDRLVDSTPVR